MFKNIDSSSSRNDFFVAIGQYKDPRIPNIQCCENDAELIIDTLKSVAYINNNQPRQTILTTKTNPERCNKTSILSNISQLADKLSEDDMLLIMFSCHGYSHNGETYLIPYDATFGDIDSYISFNWIKEILDDFILKYKVILVDACHSGDDKISFKKAYKEFRFYEETKIIDQLIKESKGLGYATSCKHDQVALIQPSGKYSIWFSSLANAIKSEINSNEPFIKIEKILSEAVYQTMVLSDKHWSMAQTPFCVIKMEGILPLGLPIKS